MRPALRFQVITDTAESADVTVHKQLVSGTALLPAQGPGLRRGGGPAPLETSGLHTLLRQETGCIANLRLRNNR